MHNRWLQPLLRRKPMPPHRWLLHQLMPNNEEPVAMRVARLLLLPRPPLLLPVGLSTALAPVRHPMPSTSLAKDTRLRHGNGMPPPARTDAATCASRTPSPCAGMGIKRRVNNERWRCVIMSPSNYRDRGRDLSAAMTTAADYNLPR
jgi:hypothetical protein